MYRHMAKGETMLSRYKINVKLIMIFALTPRMSIDVYSLDEAG